MVGRSRKMIEAGAAAVLAGLLFTRRSAGPARHRGQPRKRLAEEAPAQDRLGGDAETPLEIPARGWAAILKRVFAAIGAKRLMTEAAGITFYALLSIFPAIATLVSLYGLVANPTAIAKSLDAIGGVVPGGGVDIIRQQVTRLAANGQGSLSFGVFIGLLTSLWTSNQGVKAMVDSLNLVYGEKESRGYFHRTLLTFGFTAGGLVFILAALGGVVALPIVLNFLGLSGFTDMLLRLARWPVLLIAIVGFLAVLYRYGPNRRPARWRWVSWGSGAAALIWVVMSVLFSWYVQNFGSYNKTYGSLGAAVGFMTWIWLSSTVVLCGAQLDAEMEVQAARDSTAGERPIGTRGATAADTMAAA